jgi:ribose 5-phosphate isomerase A
MTWSSGSSASSSKSSVGGLELTSPDELKRTAAEAALAYVKPGMVLGLGTGSTARHFLEGVARRVAEGMDLKGVPTSFATAEAAKQLGIPLTSLEDRAHLDLCVDGADEVDPRLDLIKGLGGALFREKIVAAASDTFLVIVDESKLVPRLGTKAPVPVEVHPFGWRNAAEALEGLGATIELRRIGGEVFQTDNGNRIVDARFPSIRSPATLAGQIISIPGVVGHGLFLGMADLVVVAAEKGVRTLRRPKKSTGKPRTSRRSS